MATFKFRNAVGHRVWRWNNFQIEVWKFPPNFTIEPHSHPNQHIETMVLHGSANFYRQNLKTEVIDHAEVDTPADRFKKFSIPPGFCHWFSVGKSGLIVANFENWLIKPTSAAIDIKFK